MFSHHPNSGSSTIFNHWIIAAKSHTQSLRKQKMWTISWRISQLRKNVKSPPCFSSKMSCVPCPRPRGPRAQGPIEASSSSEESAPVKVTVCGAQRCWKRSKVLGQTRTWQAPKRMDVGQILPEQWQIIYSSVGGSYLTESNTIPNGRQSVWATIWMGIGITKDSRVWQIHLEPKHEVSATKGRLELGLSN